MDDFNTEANDMFTTAINENLSPLELTKEFINDKAIWNEYALNQDDENKDEDIVWWNKWKSYSNLITKYCGTGKTIGGLSYGNSARNLNEYKNFKETIKKNKATVAVDHVASDNFVSNFTQSFEFEFQKKSNAWILVEVYYINEYYEKKPTLCFIQ